nr:hypothetical protein Itr_chr01CG01030 [Ipomoea trifida]
MGRSLSAKIRVPPILKPEPLHFETRAGSKAHGFLHFGEGLAGGGNVGEGLVGGGATCCNKDLVGSLTDVVDGKTHHPEPSPPSTASRRRSPLQSVAACRSPLVATAARCPRLALATARPRCLSPICSSSPYSSGNNIDLFEVCAFEAWSL